MTTPSPFTPERSGVYRTPRALPSIRKEADGARCAWFEIDLARVRSKEQVLEAFALSCGLPRSFGHNWDALADALQDECPHGENGSVLHLQHARNAASVLKNDWDTLIEVLSESAMYWKQRKRVFIGFVDDASDLPPWT